MPIIMLINLKGGVAKTTSAVAIAECLASHNHRTLLIDADHQCMSGELLLGETGQITADRKKFTLHDLLGDMLDEDFKATQFPAYVSKRASNIGGGLEKLSVLPCSIRMDDFDTNMKKARRDVGTPEEFSRLRERRRKQMKKWLADSYDYTIVDCPPSLAVQVKFLLGVADSYIVPCIPDRMSMRGSQFLLDRVKKGSFKIPCLGTLWSMYSWHIQMHRRYAEPDGRKGTVFENLPEPFNTIVPKATRIAEATEPGQKPKTFRQKYTPEFAQMFEALCEEIVRRVEWQSGATREREVAV